MGRFQLDGIGALRNVESPHPQFESAAALPFVLGPILEREGGTRVDDRVAGLNVVLIPQQLQELAALVIVVRQRERGNAVREGLVLPQELQGRTVVPGLGGGQIARRG